MTEKTCKLVTLGCKVNQYETQLVKEALERNGYREARDDENADLCVVNTCTVTSNGDSRSRQVIRQLAKQNPGTRTLVMGCYATRDPDAVKKLPAVFEVVTNKRELPDVLGRHGFVDFPTGISRFEGRKRAYVKVQDGCILKCTYCIIPQVRPGLFSRTPDEIEAEVRRLVENGYREIIITGVHVGHFGVDTTRARSGLPRFRLPELLRRLDTIPGDWRMRLSSIEAAEMPDDFMCAVSECTHLCPHLHPALQSGSDGVLKRMRRRYTVDRFLKTANTLKQRLPGIALSTDVIVGFPGETEAEFMETIETCRRAGFMKLHLFPFSPRQGTPAATYQDRVHGEVVNERMARLTQVEEELALQFYRGRVRQPAEVMVEGLVEGQPGLVHGTDQHYCPVTIPGTVADLGQLVAGTATEATPAGLLAVRSDD